MSTRERGKERLEHVVRVGRLFELYGALLTERQREVVRLHCNEDLSFGEIAREFGVSRQAVHDAVRQAEAAMEHYETHLGLLGSSASGRARVGEPAGTQKTIPTGKIEPILTELELLRQRLATQGIIYDSTEHVRAIDEALERLRGLASG